MLKSFSLSSYGSGKWVLNTSGRNILINDNTATLLKILGESENYEEAHQKFATEFCLVIPFKDFQKLINQKLGGYNIIKDDGIEEREKLKTLFFRFKIELLDFRQVGIIAKPFTFLFNPQIFKYLFVGLIFFLLQSFFVFQPLLPEHLAKINLTLLTIAVLPNIFFHELGHIAACQKFGIKHGGMGFGVYWIFPILYADVNNIWMVDKRQRIIINMGGIFHQMVYSAVLILVFMLSGNYTILYASCFVTFSGLLQFNPFIRLDGYWILSDVTETPNLLPKSTSLLKKLFRWPSIKTIMKNPFATAAKARQSSLLLLLYGVINYAFMFVFLGWSLFKYREETLRFPITVYHLLIKAIHLEIRPLDLKAQYLSIILWYILFGSLIKNLYKKIARLYIKREGSLGMDQISTL